MRFLKKHPKPAVLASNWRAWTRALRDDPTNATKRTRYRHPDIKRALLKETSSKCVYCESKIGDTLPGDVEHMVPVASRLVGCFFWPNLTIACIECNRRKGTYYDRDLSFLNPYVDDVENLVTHLGPVVSWSPGNVQAEATVKLLELHNGRRLELISRKIEHMEHLNDLMHRMNSRGGIEAEIARIKVKDMCQPTEKYSAMVQSIVRDQL